MNSYIQLNLTKFFFLTIALLTVCINVGGQCEKMTYKKSVFYPVSVEYKEKLLQRLKAFLQNKCEENIEDLYDMLTSTFRQLNKKEDFINDMKSYYSGRNRFVSFDPVDVGEFISPKDRKPSLWFIKGCVTEEINGRKHSIMTLLEVIRENDEIFFTDITTRPNPLGKNQKCKP